MGCKLFTYQNFNFLEVVHSGIRMSAEKNYIKHYAGNYIYEDNGFTEELKFFSQPEGYVEPEDPSNYLAGFNYIYQYKDHLGNIRLSYKDISLTSTPQLEIVEENNYYPFGLKHKGYNNNVSSGVNSVAKKFKFNGQEYGESLGLNLYEMDLRQYDPAIGRWTSIDPITHHNFTPYQAFDNNPVFFADPSGADSIYNFDTKQYVINGKEVSQDEAIEYANNGGNADGNNNNKVDEDCCGWSSFISELSVFLSSSEKKVTNESITNFLTGVRGNYNQGVEDRIDSMIYYINNDIISGEYYLGLGANFIQDIANGESLFFNASGDYLNQSFHNIANMSANEWAYAAGYSTPDIALSIGGGFALSGLSSIRTGFNVRNGLKIGNVSVFTNFNYKVEGTLFQLGKGKNFRIDMDWRNGIHYHRRGPGGIGRHRPWQVKPGDKGNFWKRF